MKEQLFSGGYSPVPWPLLNVLSGNAVTLYANIHQLIFSSCSDMKRGVPISKKLFGQMLHGAHKDTVQNALEELQDYGIIQTDRHSQKCIVYYINWDEVSCICDTLSPLNVTGRNMIAGLMKDGKTRLSQLPKKDLDEICLNNRLGRKTSKSDNIWAENGQINEIMADSAQILGQKTSKSVVLADSAIILSCNMDFEVISFENNELFVRFPPKHLAVFRLNPELFGRFLAPVNNIKEEIKEKNTEAKLPKKREEIFQNNFGQKENELNNELPSIEQLTPDLDQEELEAQERSRRRREKMKAYNEEKTRRLPANPYINKPYFRKEELEEFTWDKELCTESPVKLYLYNFFSGLLDHYENSQLDDYDEEGDEPQIEYGPTFGQIDNMLILPDDLSRIARCAMEDTVGQIEKGALEVDGREIPLNMTADQLSQLDWKHICDWEDARTENNPWVRVRADYFRNIEAEDMTPSIPKSRKDARATKLRNIRYTVCLLQSDPSSLTPLETLQRKFLETYVALSEINRTDHFTNRQGAPLGRQLPWHIFQPFLADMGGFPKERFYSTIFQGQAYKEGMALERKDALFDYEASQRVNLSMGVGSKITPEILEETQDNPF